MRTLLIIALSLVSLSSFAQKTKPVQEDLASLRPHFTAPPDTAKHSASNVVRNAPMVTPRLMVNDKVNSVLDSISHLNLLRKFVSGYTIQVYSGLIAKRVEIHVSDWQWNWACVPICSMFNRNGEFGLASISQQSTHKKTW